ncbi:MAG: Tn7-like element transposition protein TnsE [Bacillota bacterium]
MKKHHIKISWPFPDNEDAQLIWISTPFRYNNKMMIHAYFSLKGETKKIRLDWGSLPFLAIQHYYQNGVLSASKPTEDLKDIEITINPSTVHYYEREWAIQGSPDIDISQSYNFTFQNQKIVLPLIEVIRSVLAPNVFLLYRLFESNSFPQYFTESADADMFHLDFSSQYELTYTRPEYLYQLLWLLTNQDVRQVYENIAFAWIQTNSIKFDWDFKQPITITARVKENRGYLTILQILKVKNKQIPYQRVSISHPELQLREKSNQPKKYTFHRLSSSNKDDALLLDQQVDGSHQGMELVQMNQQKHEYITIPTIKKLKRHTTKERNQIDENTKKYYGNTDNIRSTADVGGSRLTRGLEHQMLQDIQVQGDLKDFINLLKVLESNQEVLSIRVAVKELPQGVGKRKFAKLNDGITDRKCIIANVKMKGGQLYQIIEVDRENKSLSTIILSSYKKQNWEEIHYQLLRNLVLDSGSWTSQSLNRLNNKGISVMKSKHSKKGIRHRAMLMLEKLT